MLDVIRRQSASLAVKIILGLIVIVFVFFFGSSSLRQDSNARQTAATVNGETISSRLVNGMYEFQKDNNPLYKQLPEALQANLKQNILNSLIEDALLTSYAKKMGLRVSNEELASEIRQNPQFIKDGKFDLNGYNNVFRPGFLGTYGIDYEAWVRKSKLREKLEEVFKDGFFVSDAYIAEQALLEGTTYKFKYVLINKGDLATADQSTTEASTALWPDFKKGSLTKEQLEKYKLTETETEALHFDEISKILPANNKDSESIQRILSLSKSGDTTSEPLKLGESYLFVKLVEKKTLSTEDLEKSKIEFSQALPEAMPTQWLARLSDSLVKKASIKINEAE